jgi:uncharacterized protein YfkK (UPF0435 family)
VTGRLRFDEELMLLNEIIDSEELLQHLEIDLTLHEMIKKKEDLKPSFY